MGFSLMLEDEFGFGLDEFFEILMVSFNIVGRTVNDGSLGLELVDNFSRSVGFQPVKIKVRGFQGSVNLFRWDNDDFVIFGGLDYFFVDFLTLVREKELGVLDTEFMEFFLFVY